MRRLLAGVRIALASTWLGALLATRDPAEMPASLWQPVSLAHLLGPMPPAAYLDLLFAVALLSTLLLMAGAATRIVGPICFVAGALLHCVMYSFGKINHGNGSVLLVMLPLLFSDWGDAFSLDALRRGHRRAARTATAPWPSDWPLWLATLAVALPYLSAGALKVAHGHFLASGTFAGFLESRLLHAVHAKPWPQPAWITAATHWAVDQPTLMVVVAYGSVAFELGFWLGLCSHRLRLVAWASAVGFHTGIRLTTGISFRAHVHVCLIMAIATAMLVARERRPQPSADVPAPATPPPTAASVAPTVTAALAGSLVVLLAAPWLVPADLVLALRAPLVTLPWPLGVRISGAETDLVLLVGGALTAAATALWIVMDWRRAPHRRGA